MAEAPKLDRKNFEANLTAAQGPEYKVLYINSTRQGISPWDVRLTMGQVRETPDGPLNEDHVTIVMSPPQAKAFALNLIKTIGIYESTFGEIPDLRRPTTEPPQVERPSSSKKRTKKAKG